MTGNKAEISKPNTEIRIGKETAIAIGPARPGVAPTITPVRNPKKTMTNVTGIGMPATVNRAGP